MSKSVKIEDLSNAIREELEIYDRDIAQKIKRQAVKSIKQCVETTKLTAPVGKRTKHYRDDIAWRTLEDTYRKTVVQWYVKAPNYRLSHLLNNGHATKNGGRVEGTNFITRAHDETVRDYEKKIEDIIKNAN